MSKLTDCNKSYVSKKTGETIEYKYKYNYLQHRLKFIEQHNLRELMVCDICNKSFQKLNKYSHVKSKIHKLLSSQNKDVIKISEDEEEGDEEMKFLFIS